MKNSTAIAFAKARNPDTFARDAATVGRDDPIAPPAGADHRYPPSVASRESGGYRGAARAATTGGLPSPTAVGDTTVWAFDPATGNCTSKTYADGSTATYTRTPDGLPLRETKPSGTWKENVYDASRQIVGVVSSDGAQDASMQHDEFGRVTAESNSVANTEYYLDDYWGATNEIQTVDGVSVSFEREFDAYGRLARFARIGGDESAFGYAPHGAISVVSNGSVAVGYAFTGDALDAGYALAVQGGADFSREVFRHDYSRSCIVAVSNHCGNVSHGLEYSYDVLQRPILRNDDSFAYNVRGEVVFSRRGAENAVATYSYDDIGNLVSNSLADITNVYVSNNRNQYAAIQEISALSASPRETSYDIDGNMTRHGEWTYAYDSGNRLVSVASNGITVATMSYDTRGRRVNKVAADGTHRYFYDGWLLVYEHVVRPNNTTNEIEYHWGKDLSGTIGGAGGVGGLIYLTISNDQPSTFNLSTFQRSRVTRDSSTPQLFIPCYDNNGNIMGYWDEQGNVVAEYKYDAFGNIVSRSGPMSETYPFRFSTKYFDSETGLYYYGYRYYSPILMRWLTRDPIEEAGGVNLYAMCGNATLFRIDILGNIPVKFYTRVRNSEIGLSFKAKVVNRADDIAVTLSHKLPKANGKFIANFQYKCNAIYIWLDILIKASLQDVMPAGEILRYKVTRHGISDKDISRPAMTESLNGNTKVLSTPIKYHEIGHAEAFLDIARPMLISKLGYFPDNLSYSQVTEARKIFDQTFETIKGASNARANAREYNWYDDNGFKIINDTGVSYEVVK